jgi:alanyl-tRNA synthetase
MGSSFPEIKERATYVTRMIRAEEERFDRTLDEGIHRFEEVVEELKKTGKKTIPGKEVFFLYDTCGFPVDLVERMGEEIGFSVDRKGYEREMAAQKKRSRKTSMFDAQAPALELLKYPETTFVGYERPREKGEILGAVQDGDRWMVLLPSTPFYAEAGGQVGDTGVLRGEGFLLQVENTYQESGRTIHLARLAGGEAGLVRPGAEVSAEIDVPRRDAIRRNHTATHLVHAALRSVIGTHLHQKGSLVEASRLRFDVTHFEAIKRSDLDRVEEIVLREITRDTPVETLETDYKQAVKLGAMALFGEKYGDRVRLVKIGDFSLELCGGTHVGRTGEIGHFGVVGEGSVSAGVRRLEAYTAEGALRHYQETGRIIAELSEKLKCPPEALVERVNKLQELLASLKSAGPGKKIRETDRWKGLQVERIPLQGGEAAFISGQLEGAAMPDLLAAYDHHKAGSPRTAAALLGVGKEKVQVLVAFTPALSRAGCDAREVFQAGADEIQARGGGRPEMVRGSGNRPKGAPAALEGLRTKVREVVSKSK